MAAPSAFSHQRVGSRSSIFNTGGYGDVEQPSGSCNYRDLSFGTTAPVCGCQRFYLNSSHWQRQGQDAGLDAAWCFCGHHACFHDAFVKQRSQEQGLSGVRLEDGDAHVIEQAVGTGYNEVQPAHSPPPKAPAGLGIQSASRTETQSINTRVWQALNEFARNQEDGGNVSITTSKLPSTAAPSVIDEPTATPNRLIQDRLQQHRSMRPPVHIPQPQLPRNPDDYSATEVATPSIAGTPDFRALASSSNQAATSPGYLRPSRLEAGRPVTAPVAETIETVPLAQNRDDEPRAVYTDDVSFRALQDIVRTQNQRIEVLESLSFSHVHLDDIVDKFELFDGRLLDLEHWRGEQENQQTSPEPPAAKASSSKRRRLLPDEEASFASDGSFDSNAAAHAETAVLATLAANAETHPRIDRLENRVADLENAALPSFARPWQIQVVLLPWGRDLRGIWFSSVDATQQSLRSTTQASEEWTTALEKPKLSFKGTTSAAWTTESIEAWASEAQEWLSPKACGPKGVVFQRLASRGLVKDITLTASDARHVLNALDAAFEGLVTAPAETNPVLATPYRALAERFIPVKKVRKDSRLRFMSPAEMVTSATWSAQFLDSSVLMKVGEVKRLYVTTYEAYTQPTGGGWTWRAIQDLPEHNSARSIDGACWAYNANLDQVPTSIHSSFASHLSQSQPSQKSLVEDLNTVDSAPAPISPRSDAAVLPRQRTVSFPSSTSPNNDILKADVPKRRVASFEPKTSVPIEAYTSDTAQAAAKRRRISISPEAEAERRGVNFTPRWSREPPSPFTADLPADSRSQGTAGARRRGGTPFAYATPHSNSNFAARFDFMMGDGDTEVDTEVLADHSDRGEDEWEGVDDGTNIDVNGSDGGSLVNGDVVIGDEDELDDGI